MNRPLDRRTVLRGAGATVALPWLESLAGRSARPGAQPIRMAVLFVPNGMLPSHWTPKGEGDSYQLTPTLAPLAEVRDDLLVLTNMRNRNSLAGEGHYVKTTALLSGAKVHRTGGRDIRCGVTIDQLAARASRQHTRLGSLELSMEPVRHAEDMGYSTVYGAHISWRTPTQPAGRELHPRVAFDRLFRRARLGGDPADANVLDVVLADARRLREKLGGADAVKLDEYLESVRELDGRIDRFSRDRAAALRDLAKLARPEEKLPGFADHARLMLEIILLAFRTDTTRVASLMFGNAVSGRDFSFLDGVGGSHHSLSHHRNKPDQMAQYQRINRWHVAQYAWLLERMREVREGAGTLLDNSMVMFASGLRDGNRHDPNNLPILLAGRAGGRVRPGRHLVLQRHRPLCDLYVTMLRNFGVETERFGDSRSALDLG